MGREMPAVLLLACERPRYVHITLDSVFHNQFADRFPVFVAVDGKERQAEMLDYITPFPVEGYLFRRERMGSGQHFVRSIQTIMDFGYPYVFFLEEDVLIRPDTLAWIVNSDFESLLLEHLMITFAFTGGSRAIRQYRGFASLACADTFRDVFEFAVNRDYVGIVRTWHHNLVAEERIMEDGLFNCYVRPKGKTLWTPGEHYCGHFGFCGSRHKYKSSRLSEEESELEDRLFSGPREGWLANAVALFRPEIMEKYQRIRPKEFVYD